jgi:hypothetical protein
VTTLTRTETVMHRQTWMHQQNGSAYFASHNDDTVDRCMGISMQDWTAMGSPETLTVTIEPGDRLNTA